MSSPLDPVAQEAAAAAAKFTLKMAAHSVSAWWGRFRQRREQLAILNRAASEFASLLDLSNLRSRNLTSILKEVSDLLFETDQFEPRLAFTVMRVLGSLSAMFSKKAFFRVALLVPASEEATGASPMLKIRIGHNYSRDGTDRLRLGPDSVASVAFFTEKTQYVPDRTRDTRFTENLHRTHDYYTLLCIPLSVKGKRVGVLNIDGSVTDCLSQDDQDVAKLAARILELCLALEQLQGALRTSA